MTNGNYFVQFRAIKKFDRFSFYALYFFGSKKTLLLIAELCFGERRQISKHVKDVTSSSHILKYYLFLNIWKMKHLWTNIIYIYIRKYDLSVIKDSITEEHKWSRLN